MVSSSFKRPSLDMGLWIAQSIVAFVFTWVGSLRAFVPIRSLETETPWINAIAAQVPVRAVGAIELVLALLVLVPSMSRFWPRFAPAAAFGLALFSVAGLVEHVVHGDWVRAFGALILAALAVFVAWGRWFAEPILYMAWNDEDPSDWPQATHRPLGANPYTGVLDTDFTRP